MKTATTAQQQKTKQEHITMEPRDSGH